ncbi:MAG: hypothetical protein WD049_06405 [Candidatus Paceibacterota bacterium]
MPSQEVRKATLVGLAATAMLSLLVFVGSRTATAWYNFRRGHSARDHLPPVRDDEAPPLSRDFRSDKIICDSEEDALDLQADATPMQCQLRAIFRHPQKSAAAQTSRPK